MYCKKRQGAESLFTTNSVGDYVAGRVSHIEQLFVIGGEQIYHTFMTEYSSKIDHIYYTEIQENYQCDQFFPVSFLENYTKHKISVSEPHSGSTRFTTDTDILENQQIIYYRYDNIKGIKT